MTNNELIIILKKRFEENMSRHMNLEWTDVMKRLEINTDKIHSLIAMEITEESRILFLRMMVTEHSFFMIVLQKVQSGAEIPVMIRKDKKKETKKEFFQMAMLLI